MKHNEEFAYAGSTFSGDSGGPILSREGHVCGMHQEIVTAVQDLDKLLEDKKDMTEAVVATLRSVVSGTGQLGRGMLANGLHAAMQEAIHKVKPPLCI